jgi:hypothetical protein
MTEEHVFMFGTALFYEDGSCVIPECSCGWEGRPVDDAEDAQEAWENHCEMVFMEVTAKQADVSEGQS